MHFSHRQILPCFLLSQCTLGSETPLLQPRLYGNSLTQNEGLAECGLCQPTSLHPLVKLYFLKMPVYMSKHQFMNLWVSVYFTSKLLKLPLMMQRMAYTICHMKQHSCFFFLISAPNNEIYTLIFLKVRIPAFKTLEDFSYFYKDTAIVPGIMYYNE